jgi:transcriptional regulator with XRE-family HTH domain
MEDKNIYSKIRDIRQARGLSVNKLAEKIGEDYQKVGRIERGKRSLTIEYLMKVSKALDTPLENFLTNENSKKDGNTNSTTNSLDLLNEIVTLVEENSSRLPNPLDTSNKGRFISKLYEYALKFPEAQQRLFLDSFFQGLLSISTKT